MTNPKIKNIGIIEINTLVASVLLLEAYIHPKIQNLHFFVQILKKGPFLVAKVVLCPGIHVPSLRIQLTPKNEGGFGPPKLASGDTPPPR